MLVFEKIKDLKDHLEHIRLNQTIGLVPTMGALHNGHLSLVTAAKQECEVVIVTIFVNPTQFNKPEDLKNYPSNVQEDLKLLKEAQVDVVFTPSAEEIYPEEPQIHISFGAIEKQLEGKFRPGHFAGVGQVVSKLFNMIQPHTAFFGQKDLQQFYVISSLVKELNFPVTLHMVPTKREKNGLAMSSRNLRLNEKQKEEASLLHRSLTLARESLQNNNSIASTQNKISQLFDSSPSLELEYFEVVETTNFMPLDEIKSKTPMALCIAAEIGGVRLIDNILLNA